MSRMYHVLFSADEDPKCYEFTWSSDKENQGETNSTNSCGVSDDPPVPCYLPLLSTDGNFFRGIDTKTVGR